MAVWNEPKTDWTVEDRFTYQDYNRIKNNLEYLWEEASEMYGDFLLEDMGEDIGSVKVAWQAKYFNAFEANVDAINKIIFTQNYGIRQTFYINGPFIRHSELNRLESAILSMKKIIDGTKAGRRRLSFRLGGMKGIKV